MDYKEILELMKEMNRTDITKIEIETAGTKLSMEKEAKSYIDKAHLQEEVGGQESRQDVHKIVSTQSIQIVENPINVSKNIMEENLLHQVLSPMVGTFYGTPSPEKPAFVKVGDRVKKGQTLCIIEAMKLMNEIESEVDGEVVEIFIRNEEMVPYGKPLLSIREA